MSKEYKSQDEMLKTAKEEWNKMFPQIIHKPRVYGYQFNPKTIDYDCECGNITHDMKECQYGHKIDWRGKHKTWKIKE